MANACGVILVRGSTLDARQARIGWAPQLVPVANRPLLDDAVTALEDAGSRPRPSSPTTRRCRRGGATGRGRQVRTVALLEVPLGSGELDSLRARGSRSATPPPRRPPGRRARRGHPLRRAATVPRRRGRRRHPRRPRRGTERRERDGGFETPSRLESSSSQSRCWRRSTRSTRRAAGLDWLVARAQGQRPLTVEERVVPQGWRFTGGAADILDGNRIALDEIEGDWHPDSLERTRIEGQVIIHPMSQVQDTLLRGPCLIGPNTIVRHAYIGPTPRSVPAARSRTSRSPTPWSWAAR